MAVIEEIPASLRARHAAGSTDGFVTAAAADLTLDGAFGREWVVIDHDRLQVYRAEGESFRTRVDIALTDIKDPGTEALIGGASLLATVKGERMELVRFTNAQEGKFRRVAKYLTEVADWHKARAEGAKPGEGPEAGNGKEAKEEKKEPKPYPEFAEDPEEANRCGKCGLVLAKDSKVCPACISKGRATLPCR